MKIGIISVNNAHNFGTTMQAYALKQYLDDQGHEAQIINYRLPSIEKSYWILRRNKPKKQIRPMAGYAAKYLWMIVKRPFALARRRRYENFFAEYFNLTEPFKSVKELRNAKLDFDLIIAGSDQIWNDAIIGNLDPAFFCDFGGPETIRASYAASLGNDTVPEDQHLAFQRFLNGLDFISVRESGAQKSLQALTDKPVDLVLDPTLLVERDVFDRICEPSPYQKDYIYVHVHHHTAKGPELVEAARKLSQQTGLPVVHNIIGAEFENTLGHACGAGPKETLALLAGAKYVITQSFHATVFSIIYGKNFLTLEREKYSERLRNLLEILGLQEHFVRLGEELPDISSLSVDHEDVQKRLKEYRKQSVAFMDKVLHGEKAPRIPNWFQSHDAFTCYGCSACKDICPVGAIAMEEDQEGFVQPRIDDAICIHCKKCETNCIYQKKRLETGFDSKAYIAFNLEEENRVNSSSGGMFFALCQPILQKNGFVVGVKYDENFTVTYDIADSVEGCRAFCYSKYVEPQHNDIYRKTKKALETGRPVLFTGAPCKIAGLKNYLGRDYPNLYLVDIICECSSSPMAFRAYLDSKEKQYGGKIAEIRFRDKREGWRNRATSIQMDNGKSEITKQRWNIYYHCFVSGYMAKRSCYQCEFCGDNGVADLTIGDFWGLKNFRKDMKDDEKGVSAVKVGTQKGLHLLDSIRDNLFLEEVRVCDIYDNNHSWPTAINKVRGKILKEIREDPEHVQKIMKQYNPRYNKPKNK